MYFVVMLKIVIGWEEYYLLSCQMFYVWSSCTCILGFNGIFLGEMICGGQLTVPQPPLCINIHLFNEKRRQVDGRPSPAYQGPFLRWDTTNTEH
jgi:hypothetical protein